MLALFNSLPKTILHCGGGLNVNIIHFVGNTHTLGYEFCALICIFLAIGWNSIAVVIGAVRCRFKCVEPRWKGRRHLIGDIFTGVFVTFWLLYSNEM